MAAGPWEQYAAADSAGIAADPEAAVTPAVQEEPAAPAGPWEAYQNKPGFSTTVKRTAGQMASATGITAEDVVGEGGIASGIRNWGKGVEAENPAGVQSFGDIADKPGLYVKESLGNALPQMAPQAIGGLAGRVIGGIAGGALGSVVPGVGTAAGAIAGQEIVGRIGQALPTFIQEYGGIRDEQQQNGVDNKLGAVAAAVPSTAIEFALGPQRLLGNLLEGATSEAIKAMAKQPAKEIFKQVGKETLKGGLGEASEEYPQTILEKWGAQADPFSLDTVKRIVTSADTQHEALFSAAMALPGGGISSGALYSASILKERNKPEAPAVTPPAPEQGIAGLLPAPVYPGTPGEQIVSADAERQAAIDAADKNAASVYAERAAYEEAQKALYPFGLPTLTTDPAPLQQRIDEMLNIDHEKLKGVQRTNYEKTLEAAFAEQVGISHDQNGLEIPLTMGAYLDARVAAADMGRAIHAKTSAQDDSKAPPVNQTPAVPSIPVVGALSAAANLAVQSGAHAATVAKQAAAQAAQNTTPEGKAGTPAGAQPNATAPASGTLAGIAAMAPTTGGQTNVASHAQVAQKAPQANAPQAGTQPAATQAAGQSQGIDLSNRTDAQLNYLTQHGKNGNKEAAVAELAKRSGVVAAPKAIESPSIPNGDGITNQPEVAPGQSSQQSNQGAENVQAQAEVLTQSGAVSNAAPATDKNGFVHGPNGSRTRIAQHKAGSNLLDPTSDVGAFTYEVRKGDDDPNPLNMAVNKDGNLVPTSRVLGKDGKSNGTAWVPANEEDAAKVRSLLEQRAKTEIGSAERKSIDAQIKEIVTGNSNGGTGNTVAADVAITNDGDKAQTVDPKKEKQEPPTFWTSSTPAHRKWIMDASGLKQYNAVTPWSRIKPEHQAQLIEQWGDKATDQNQIKNEMPSAAKVSETATAPAKDPIKKEAADPIKAKKKNERNKIDPSKDSLLVAIAKAGGMDTDELLSNGIDSHDITFESAARVKKDGQLSKKRRMPITFGFALPLHKKGGMSFDAMREAMQQYGYLPEGATKNDAIDLFKQELVGDPVYTAQAIEVRQEQDQEEFDKMMQEEQDRIDAELAAQEIVEDETGFNDLSFDEQSLAKDFAEFAFGENGKQDDDATRAGMRALGFTEEEINDELAKNSQAQRESEEITAGPSQESGAGWNGNRAEDAKARQRDGEQSNFGLDQQTNEQAAEQFAQQQDGEPKTPNKEQADRERDAVPFSLGQQSQAKPQGVQAGLFTADGRVSADAKRGEAGASLTKEQRNAVIKTLVDVYRKNNAPKEFKGIDNNGNERSGYAYSPEFFVKSDITGSMVRYYVTMPDGRIAHPTELFADYTQSDIDAALQKEIDAERQAKEVDESRLASLRRRIGDTLNDANRKYNQANPNRDDTVPAILSNGKSFIRTAPENVSNDLRILGEEWSEAKPTESIDDLGHPEQFKAGELARKRGDARTLPLSLSIAKGASREMQDAWFSGFDNASGSAESVEVKPKENPDLLDAAKIQDGYSHRSLGGLSDKVKMEQEWFDSAANDFAEKVGKGAESDDQKALSDKLLTEFKEEYKARRYRVMDVGSSVVSSAVAGRNNFNSAQAGKRGSALDRAEQAFSDWHKDAVENGIRAIRNARSPEQVAAERQAKEDKAARNKAKLLELIGKLMAFKKGDDLRFGNYPVARVTMDRDGYPSSVTVDATDLTDNKFDIAKMLFNGDKDALRSAVDEILSARMAEPEPAQNEGKSRQYNTMADIDSAIEGIYDGAVSLDDYKAAFRGLIENKDAIVGELNKQTKDSLLARLGPMMAYRLKTAKKSEIVDGSFEAIRNAFALRRSFGPNSYTMSTGALARFEADKLAALTAMVEATTADDLKEFADEIAKDRGARKDKIEATKDPKTIDDFDNAIRLKKAEGMTFTEARMSLTPEQRAEYDKLRGAKTRDERKARADQQKNDIRVAAQTTDGQVVETKHTKTGEDLFVVKAAERVERDVYQQWNDAAKKLGGRYSGFRGNGAVPGFQFKTRANADAFLKFLGGDVEAAQDAIKERRDVFSDDKSQSAVERLTEMADRLEEKADESLGRERKVNTERRARFAAAAENAANAEKAMATTMRRIASAISEGTAQFLDRVRQKAQIEYLNSTLRTAKENELRAKYPNYGDQEKHRGDPATADTADYAEFPQYTMMRSDLANLARRMVMLPNMKMLGQRILKVADDTSDVYNAFAKEHLLEVSKFGSVERGGWATFSTMKDAERSIEFSKLDAVAVPLQIKRGEYRIVLSPSEAINRGIWKGEDRKITLSQDVGSEIVEKLGKLNRKAGKVRGIDAPPQAPWQFENAYNNLNRLSGMGIEQPWEFRAALREFANLKEAPKERDKIKEMERAMIGRKNDGLDFFPTPADTAQSMIEAAEISEGMAVLEPSAGMGHIAEQIRGAGIDPDVIEFNGYRRELLEAKGFNVIGNDFLDLSPRGFSYGDVFQHKDGRRGIMRGSGGLGSGRVGFIPEGKAEREFEWVNREDLTGIEKRGGSSGYDRIIMNPPFSNRRDAEHVQHAYSLLKPGGRIVAIMGEGVFFGQDKKAQAFREWLEEVGGTSEKLDEGTFLDPSLPVNTATNARMVVIDKPEGATAPVDVSENGAGNIAMPSSMSPADKAIYGMAAEGKSAEDILKFIASASRNPFYRQLAKLLLKTGIAPTITVGDGKGWKMNAGEGNKYAAGYNPATNTVSLFRPASAERNMIHELMHAATLKALSGKGLAAGQMRSLYNHIKKTGKLKGMYGMSDVDEFIAEAFTNPKFQDQLKKIDAPAATGGKLSSAWDWFVRVVRGILGLKQNDESALAQALEIGVGVMREDMKLRNGQKSVMVDGVMRPTMNSEGKPIHYTQDGIENFWRWFDGVRSEGLGKPGQQSKNAGGIYGADNGITGLDPQGRPRVFFHGTKDSIDAFDLGHKNRKDSGWLGRGVYLTTDKLLAGSYANIKAGSGNNTVMPLYAAIRNPFFASLELKRRMSRATQEQIDVVTENLKRAGYDGVVLEFNDQTAEVVAFYPEQVKSATENSGDFSSNDERIRYNVADDHWGVSEPSKMDDVIYALQDKHIDTKRVMQAIMGAGKNIRDQFNPYLQEELFHGRSAKGVKDFLDLELRPLLKQMQDAKVDMGDFEEYLWNRHAEERNKQIAKINPEMPDGGSGIETATARAYLAGLGAEQRRTFESLAAKVEAMNKASQRVLVESGLEKQSTIDAWNNAYKHYVPLQREDVDNGHTGGTGKGFSIRGSSTKRAMGSGKTVVDIIANLTMQRERNIVRAEKNRVSNALMGLAVENPNADFWTVDKAPKERVVEETAIYTVLDEDGAKVGEFTRMSEAEKLANKTPGSTIDQTWGDRVTERVVPGFKNRDNVLLTRVNGEDHYIIFNERDERAMRMATALKNLDVDNLGRVLSLVGRATRYLSAINTQYNPVFGVINLIRDAQGAILNLSSTPLAGEQKRVLAYTKDALIGIYKDIRAHRAGLKPSSNWASLFEEFQREGGATGYRDQYANAEARAEAIKAELEQFKEGKAKQLTRGLFGWLSDYNETMENAVRLASYKAAIEKGMSKAQAASLAKNITVNFNRKGQMATQVGALYAFFNASVQGTARIAGTLFDMKDGDIRTARLSSAGKKIVYGGIMLGSMQALLLAAAGFGDDEPPDFIKERNLILPIGDGKYLTLAMPLGYHVFPGIGRLATEFILNGGKDPLKKMAAFGSMFAEALNPIGNSGFSLQTITPSVIDPLAALAENRDFTGKEIYQNDFNKLNPTPGFTRAKDTATAWSKAIAEGLNFITGGTDYKPGLLSWSPDSIDYLIGQLTGGVGREVNKVAQTVGSGMTGEDLPLYKVPLVGRFVGDTQGKSGESAKFYNSVREINMHEAEYKGLIGDGKRQEAAEYLAENPAVRLIMLGNQTERAVKKLKDAKRNLIENDAPHEKVAAMEDQIAKTMKFFNDRVEVALAK